ncbi:hypothetical protein H6F74_15705 [Trichocoleus sp. FACHB-90]|uniref:hypothetical protein n=1 Tax=Cyanophyceae TaxID=3028117 RepID=UPI0016895CEF|nr:hypothetical protein [Trichocoleus sp. FACHB-90]MBD1927678.1 hypothetical protein [Trichocoleus sp. FACHB-90]
MPDEKTFIYSVSQLGGIYCGSNVGRGMAMPIGVNLTLVVVETAATQTKPACAG